MLAAVAEDAGASLPVEELAIEVGTLRARVAGCEATLGAEPVPRRIWAAVTRYARGRGALEEAVAGRVQSSHLGQILADDWDAPLVPPPWAIRRTCVCDPDGACVHVAAAGRAFADAIDRDPGALLRWRGCVERTEPLTGDPWAGGEPPALGPPRPLPPGAVLKRLGPSGIRVGDADLADVLLPAYEAFAAGDRRPS
jgi:hypothetical protein